MAHWEEKPSMGKLPFLDRYRELILAVLSLAFCQKHRLLPFPLQFSDFGKAVPCRLHTVRDTPLKIYIYMFLVLEVGG